MSPLVSVLRTRERSHRPVLRVLGGRGQSESFRPPRGELAEPGRGTVLGGRRTPVSHPQTDACVPSEPMPADVGPGGTRAAAVLLAGADARRRTMLRVELGAKLPARTRFCEAGEVAEVLERAPRSSMVILTGDLDDADGESLVRLLGRRHPQLPVIRVQESAPANTRVHD
jgi:hypothetical protein